MVPSPQRILKQRYGYIFNIYNNGREWSYLRQPQGVMGMVREANWDSCEDQRSL